MHTYNTLAFFPAQSFLFNGTRSRQRQNNKNLYKKGLRFLPPGSHKVPTNSPWGPGLAGLGFLDPISLAQQETHDL